MFPKRITQSGLHQYILSLKQQKFKNKETIKSSKGINNSYIQGTELLQVRRKWHSTFKWMKGKNLQLRKIYQTRFSLRFDRSKFYKQAKAKRIEHHQTSFTRTLSDSFKQKKKRPQLEIVIFIVFFSSISFGFGFLKVCT